MSRRSGPRIRTIKPEWAEDEAIGTVSRDARLLYIGLTSQADDEGRQRAGLPLVRSRLYPYDVDLELAEIDTWLAELARQGLIVRYEVSGNPFVVLTRWADDQRIDRPTPSKFPEPPSSARDSSRGIAEESRRIVLDHDHDHDRDRDHSSATADEVREDVEQVCTLLADMLVANGSKRPTITKAWRDQARLLLDKDKRPLDEVLRLVRWCQQDAFWRSNILSLPKFREKYDQLRLKASTAGRSANGTAVDPAEADRLAEKFGGLKR